MLFFDLAETQDMSGIVANSTGSEWQSKTQLSARVTQEVSQLANISGSRLICCSLNVPKKAPKTLEYNEVYRPDLT